MPQTLLGGKGHRLPRRQDGNAGPQDGSDAVSCPGRWRPAPCSLEAALAGGRDGQGFCWGDLGLVCLDGGAFAGHRLRDDFRTPPALPPPLLVAAPLHCPSLSAPAPSTGDVSILKTCRQHRTQSPLLNSQLHPVLNSGFPQWRCLPEHTQSVSQSSVRTAFGDGLLRQLHDLHSDSCVPKSHLGCSQNQVTEIR